MKIAMIGAGFANQHLQVLVKEPGVEIVGHVARRPESAQAAAHKWGGRAYVDVDSLLESEQVDAAWVCVPPGAHGEIEYALLERNIPFFVEKPLSADRRTAEEIGEVIARKHAIVGVGYHMRAMDTLPEVRVALAEKPARMAVGQWHTTTPPPLWWRHQATSGGQMVEQATHLVDLARLLLGEGVLKGALAARHERPRYPDADVADTSAALVEFPGATVGVFSATCVLAHSASVHLQLMCEGLLITITQQSVTYDTGAVKREVKIASDPVLIEDRAFLRAVESGDPALLLSSYDDALKTHRLTHAILEAGGAAR
jgi:predicted dehydrogenase